MALKTETATIRGRSVTTTQLPVLASYMLFAKLSKLVGPALASVKGLEIDSLEALLTNNDLSVLGAPLTALAVEVLAADKALPREILACTAVVVEGRRIELTSEDAINVAFEGDLVGLLSTVWFAVRVNYADFFGEAAGKLGGLLAAVTARVGAAPGA